MAVITITIADSPIQIIEGIPQTVAVSANIASTIFYTLDGSVPTINSDIIIGPITMPTDTGSVILQVFASNGTDSSAIIEKTYTNNVFSSMRRPRDTIQGTAQPFPGPNLFPFGSNSTDPNVIYGNIGGEVVSTPGNTNHPAGWDGKGNIVGYTDLPAKSYQNIYSETDSEGRYGRFLGNLPAKVQVRVPPPPTDESQENSLLFNSRSLVIFQDGTKPPVDPTVARQNRQFFSLENSEVVRDGSNYYNTGLEVGGPTGSLTRPQYNDRDGTVTYYYFDSQNLRWIISKENVGVRGNPTANLSHILRSPRDTSVGKVFKWIPFKRQFLG